jgi:GNAT superfamily N-acetyltransferase
MGRARPQARPSLLKLLSQDALVISEDAPTFVAEKDGRVVGMVTLCVFRTLTGAKAYLEHLVVAPEWRLRGIGRALVQYAIEQARAAGASRIDLTANTQKQAGHTLYWSLGPTPERAPISPCWLPRAATRPGGLPAARSHARRLRAG